MTLPTHRPYNGWLLQPPHDYRLGIDIVQESASSEFILETLSTYSEVAAVGRDRFLGALSQRNELWSHFRNYLRQGMSNFQGALALPNRSAGLLYYYAAMNFAKAELLDAHVNALVNKRIGHGLSFNPTSAKTVSGDLLKVVPGIFPLLYESRTGLPLPIGTILPVKRLLLQVPEIGTQVAAVGGGQTQVWGLLQMLATDGAECWSFLALENVDALGETGAVSRRLLLKHYKQVAPPNDWRDHFALSRRYSWRPAFFESRISVPAAGSGSFPPAAADISLALKDILAMRTSEDWDAHLAPSLYKSRMLPMPPSLARYALTYYASSLVRYKPQMFDAQAFADQAYLFDAIARELALPMLQDVLAAIKRRPVHFERVGSMRL